MSTAASTRRQQLTDELCAAAIRALAGDPAVHFRGRALHRGERPVPASAPHLRPAPDIDDFGSFRGAADGMALRIAHSDADLHHQLRPTGPVPRMVFEMLEQFRAESLADPAMPGVRANLSARFARWCSGFHHEGHTETAHGILLYTLAQVCRSRVTGEPVLAETEDVIEATRFALASRLGRALDGLRRCRADQAAYAEHALAVACHAGELVEAATERHDGAEEAAPHRFGFFLEQECDDPSDLAGPTSGRSRGQAADAGSYRVFATAYDRELAVADLVRPELLAEYRQRIDRRIVDCGISVGRVARHLRQLLDDLVPDGWQGGQEEGLVDARRLTQLITSPGERRLFRTEQDSPVADGVVTFLVDCSGSMKEHAESVAIVLDVLTRALDRVGVGSEVLGFTTGAWNGGRAAKAWRRAGRPKHPGRLNEVRHLVFKDADTPYRRARPALAGLLKADLFKEGLDGEAVAWACRRLRSREERRKLLVVFSDGSPMDSATALANGAHYLDHHLADVVRREESDGAIRIHAVGVGLDLSASYPRAHALDLSDGVRTAVLTELATTFVSGQGRENSPGHSRTCQSCAGTSPAARDRVPCLGRDRSSPVAPSHRPAAQGTAACAPRRPPK